MTEDFKVTSNDVSTNDVPVEDAPEPMVSDSVLTSAERVLDMADDMKDMHEINPMDVYRTKNRLIVESEMPLEKKLDLLDQNQEKMLSNNERALDIHAKNRLSKIDGYRQAVAAVVVGFVLTVAFKDKLPELEWGKASKLLTEGI